MTALVPATNFLPNPPLNLKGRPHIRGNDEEQAYRVSFGHRNLP